MKLLQAAAKAAGDVGTQYTQSIIDERILDKRMERLMGVERAKHGMEMERLDKDWDHRDDYLGRQNTASMDRLGAQHGYRMNELSFQANQPQAVQAPDGSWVGLRPGELRPYDEKTDKPMLNQSQQAHLKHLRSRQEAFDELETITPEQQEERQRIQDEINRLTLGEEGYEQYEQRQKDYEFRAEVRGVKEFWMGNGMPQSKEALLKLMTKKGVPTTPEAFAQAWKEISAFIDESAEGDAASATVPDPEPEPAPYQPSQRVGGEGGQAVGQGWNVTDHLTNMAGENTQATSPRGYGGRGDQPE